MTTRSRDRMMLGAMIAALMGLIAVGLGGPARAGSASEWVRAVQVAVIRESCNPGPVDGIYGPLTAAGIRCVQVANGLTANGYADEPTSRVLFPWLFDPAATTTTTSAPVTTTTAPTGGGGARPGTGSTAVYGRCTQYEHLLVAAGLPVLTFSRLMWRESGCTPTVRSRTNDHGLLQINAISRTYLASKGVAWYPYDPWTNVRMAKVLYQWGGLRPWGLR